MYKFQLIISFSIITVIRFNLNPVDNIINENGGSQSVNVVLDGEFIQELSFIVTASTDGSNQATTAMGELMQTITI